MNSLAKKADLAAIRFVVKAFVVESNGIEDIYGEPDLVPSLRFLDLDRPCTGDLCKFVRSEAGAALRVEADMNVKIGDHTPPAGGPDVGFRIGALVCDAVNNAQTPYTLHCRYEALHPFMDGNGRSGRILWAWQMLHHDIRPGLSLGFLHAFYYQTLAAGQPNA